MGMDIITDFDKHEDDPKFEDEWLFPFWKQPFR